MTKSEELTIDTINYINNTDINKRKKLGQYFTKRSIREELINNLPKTIFYKKGIRILDPGCGTGEFLLSCKEKFSNPKLEGWDIDDEIVEICKKNVPIADLYTRDALIVNENDANNRFDLIIGNPPYFEYNPEKEIRQQFQEIIGGRVNIYGLFIYKCLNLLNKGGYLAFVIPPSMNNGAYFSKLRKYIIENATIEFLKVLDSSLFFEGANQTVMLLILKKGRENSRNEKYIFSKSGITIFTEDKKKLITGFEGKYTLKELGYYVRTGRLVWNHYKHHLSKDNTHTLLIWPHNISGGGIKLDLENDKKKQYVNIDSFDEGPAIVVNRIVGQAGKAKIKAAIVEEKVKFIGENHVNVIFPQKSTSQKLSLKDILIQLNSPEKLKIIQKVTGNTQLSKTELENLFPFDL